MADVKARPKTKFVNVGVSDKTRKLLQQIAIRRKWKICVAADEAVRLLDAETQKAY